MDNNKTEIEVKLDLGFCILGVVFLFHISKKYFKTNFNWSNVRVNAAELEEKLFFLGLNYFYVFFFNIPLLYYFD